MKRVSDEDQGAERGAVRSAAAAFRRQRRWVVLTIAAVLALTALVYALVPRQYTARASVWLDNRFDMVVGAPGAPARSDAALSRNTELRVLASADVAAAVVDKLGLARLPGVGQPGDGRAVSPDEGRRRAIAAVRKGLEVDTAGRSLAVAARYRANDPELAAGILNQTIDEYVEQRRTGGARGRRREELRIQVETAREEVIRAEAALAALRSASSLIGSADEAERLRRDIAALDTQIERARRDDSAARGAPARSERLRGLRARQAQLNTDRAALVQRGGPVAELAAIDQQLIDITRNIAAEPRAAVQPRVEVARDRVAALNAERNRAAAALRARTEARTRLATLERTAEAARNRYAALLQEYNLSSPAVQAQRGGAHVIARAVAPTRPDFPDPIKFAIAGAVAAPTAAALLVLILELLARGFRTRRHVERKLGVPVIGMVPDLGKLPGVDRSGGDRVEPIDYLFTDPRSPYNAAFRSIHAGLRLGGGAGSPRSVAISSALPEEGKTTVSVCLARSAALAGLRVVLIDCDGRRPAASRALAAHVEVGVVEVLEGKVPVKQALIRDTPSGAWVLAHSTDGPVSNDMIGSDAMAHLIATLAKDFDLIVLDTAPALALAEARSVAALADRVVLVARWRKTPIQATRIALDLLRRSGAEVSGVALTLVGR